MSLLQAKFALPLGVKLASPLAKPWSSKDQVFFAYGGEATLDLLQANLALPQGVKPSLGFLKTKFAMPVEAKLLWPCCRRS